MDDATLLKQYIDADAQDAFTALVERYTPLVYAGAVRRAGEHLAADITQAVFILLARKAPTLRPRQVRCLAGWLFRATRFTAAEALRRERRRTDREHLAEERRLVSMETDAADTSWKDVAPHIDVALDRLGCRDRQAVLLRCVQGASYADVGVAIGLSENAATKRVARALDKLRRVLGRRGAVLSSSALISMLAADAVTAAPAEVAAGCLGAAAVAGAGATATLAHATANAMFLAQAKAVALAGCAVVSCGIAATALVAGLSGDDIAEQVELLEVAPFPLVYRAKSTLPDGSLEFQVNGRRNGRTYFTGLSGEVAGWRVVAYHQQPRPVSVGSGPAPQGAPGSITLARDGYRVVLPHTPAGLPTNRLARLRQRDSGVEFWIQPGDTLGSGRASHRLVRLDDTSHVAVITRLSDGRECVLRKEEPNP